MSGPKIDCQPFPSELGPTVEVHKEVTARKSSSQDGAIDLDSTSSIDSSTEHPTVISGNATSRLQLRGDSRHSNRSMPPATPSPPVSGNNSPNNQVTRQRRSPPQSAISRTSVRSQTPREELDPNADLDCSRCVILHPSLSPYKVISSQPPETPPTAAIIKKPAYEIKCCCKQSQPLILIHTFELHLMIQGSANENDTLNTYNLVDKMENIKRISKTNVVGHATCKMFFHSNKVTLLSGQFDDSTLTWKLRLYQFDTAKTSSTVQLSWKQVSRFSNLQLELKNSIPVSYEKDGIILTSIQLYQENRQTVPALVIYMLSQSKGTGSERSSEKNWKAIKLRLRLSKYEIQSCIVISNYLYCCLLHEAGASIYQCDLTLFQKQKHMQCIESTSNLPGCHLKDPKIFLSVHKSQVIIITISPNVDSNKTTLEIKKLLNPSTISPPVYRFEFACLVKIVTAFVVPDVEDLEIVVVYHKSNSCHINRIIPMRLA